METFPAFFPLRGKRVVIAGEDGAAQAKARLFDGSPAEVVRLTGAAAIDPAAYAGADLIFVASFDPAFREGAARAARAAGAPLNVADAPELSDFHTPAIVDRGQVVAAIGTAGASPLLASLLRAEVEMRVPEGAGRVAALLGDRRAAIGRAFPDLAARRAFLRAVLAGPAAEAAMAGDAARAGALLDGAIAGGLATQGRVSFIEGAATPDLISLRAARASATADVIVAGEDGRSLLASHGRRDAERLAPGAADAPTLADLARAGRRVAIVSAKADQALVEALRSASVTVEVLSPASAS
ncbi:MAG: NAD(P)-dependent oxidoreductase [Caulobacteraceae bacterium]